MPLFQRGDALVASWLAFALNEADRGLAALDYGDTLLNPSKHHGRYFLLRAWGEVVRRRGALVAPPPGTRPSEGTPNFDAIPQYRANNCTMQSRAIYP